MDGVADARDERERPDAARGARERPRQADEVVAADGRHLDRPHVPHVRRARLGVGRDDGRRRRDARGRHGTHARHKRLRLLPLVEVEVEPVLGRHHLDRAARHLVLPDHLLQGEQRLRVLGALPQLHLGGPRVLGRRLVAPVTCRGTAHARAALQCGAVA
eukprot:5171413-Prymnesium_polylepis.1